MIRYAVILVAVVLMSLPGSADVLPKNQRFGGRVHVVANTDQTLSFFYCGTADLSHCQKLGYKDSYTVTEIQYIQTKLHDDARRTITGDAAQLALSAGVGAIAACLGVAHPPVAVVTLKAFLAAAGTATFVAKPYIFPDNNSPIRKLRTSKVMKSQLQASTDTYVNEPIMEVAHRIDDALKSIL